MPHMNTRLPTVITLPRRADAAEFWFARLSHRPYAMLLHSGHADHPYSRFDILVADPLETPVTRGNLTTVGGLESSDDPLTLLQLRLDALGLSASPHPDLPFGAARSGCLAMISGVGMKRCLTSRSGILPFRIWR